MNDLIGLYWPGFFPTDITTPGRTWVPEFHRNLTLRMQGKLPPYEYPETVREIEARVPSIVHPLPTSQGKKITGAKKKSPAMKGRGKGKDRAEGSVPD